mmetsp:Transcript_8815/g.27905  ORF Transcript_8815/g.27905 Transcript_8815/m.27905 type:complete len:460 (+) Transcript_8815:3083-4462(+)
MFVAQIFENLCQSSPGKHRVVRNGRTDVVEAERTQCPNLDIRRVLAASGEAGWFEEVQERRDDVGGGHPKFRRRGASRAGDICGEMGRKVVVAFGGSEAQEHESFGDGRQSFGLGRVACAAAVERGLDRSAAAKRGDGERYGMHERDAATSAKLVGDGAEGLGARDSHCGASIALVNELVPRRRPAQLGHAQEEEDVGDDFVVRAGAVVIGGRGRSGKAGARLRPGGGRCRAGAGRREARRGRRERFVVRLVPQLERRDSAEAGSGRGRVLDAVGVGSAPRDGSLDAESRGRRRVDPQLKDKRDAFGDGGRFAGNGVWRLRSGEVSVVEEDAGGGRPGVGEAPGGRSGRVVEEREDVSSEIEVVEQGGSGRALGEGLAARSEAKVLVVSREGLWVGGCWVGVGGGVAVGVGPGRVEEVDESSRGVGSGEVVVVGFGERGEEGSGVGVGGRGVVVLEEAG